MSPEQVWASFEAAKQDHRYREAEDLVPSLAEDPQNARRFVAQVMTYELVNEVIRPLLELEGFRAPLDERLGTDAKFAATLVDSLAVLDGKVSPEFLKRVPDAAIEDMALELEAKDVSDLRTVELVMAAMDHDRRARLKWGPLTSELAALYANPAAQAPLLRAKMVAGYVYHFCTDLRDERPDPAGLAFGEHCCAPTCAKPLSLSILREMVTGREHAGPGLGGIPIPEWARLAMGNIESYERRTREPVAEHN